jgi:hypothetical protein
MICGYCMKVRGKASKVLFHQKHGCSTDPRWGEVVRARRAGHASTADRIARKILGVAEPMSEEAKEKLREYNETHKEQIKARRKAQAAARKNLKAKMMVTRR